VQRIALKFAGTTKIIIKFVVRTDKKENEIFLIYEDIQMGAVAKGFLILSGNTQIFYHIWGGRQSYMQPLLLNFPIFEENFIFFFISVAFNDFSFAMIGRDNDCHFW
jgi:hypothetical protein